MIPGVVKLRDVFFCRNNSISTEVSSSEDFKYIIRINKQTSITNDILSRGYLSE